MRSVFAAGKQTGVKVLEQVALQLGFQTTEAMK
jgi:hypothetical protein